MLKSRRTVSITLAEATRSLLVSPTYPINKEC